MGVRPLVGYFADAWEIPCVSLCGGCQQTTKEVISATSAEQSRHLNPHSTRTRRYTILMSLRPGPTPALFCLAALVFSQAALAQTALLGFSPAHAAQERALEA